MNRRFVGTVVLLAVSAALVLVAGCTRPMSTGRFRNRNRHNPLSSPHAI